MKKPISVLLFLELILFGPGLLSCGAPETPPVEEETPATEEPILPYPNFRGGELQGEKNFAKLINNYAEGRVEPTPWAGFWWPYTGNGIASGSYGGGLSPAGKYDAARGGTTSAQMWEIIHHGAGVRGVQSWWGHCNGWTVASALFKEPDSDAMVNGVRFSVADQKALFTEAGMSASADFFGNRVDWGNDYATPKFTDTVPDQFFLLLTNYIGKLKHAILIDRYTGDQVWNQPLAGYRFEYPTPADYLGADPAAPRVFRILVTSIIWWMRDDVPPGAITPPFNFELENEYVQSRALRMEVWLDGPVVFGPDGKITSSGDVIVSREGDYFAGGAWRIGDGYFSDGWPDYMWVPYSIIKPTDLEDDFVNIHVDINWLKEHLLVPGGRDDVNASPRPVEPAPVPPSPRPTGAPTPTPQPTTLPTSVPTTAPTTVPTTIPTTVPTSLPTSVPTVVPTPRPTFVPIPTFTPTPLPTFTMTARPTPRPTFTPTIRPTSQPTIAPTPTLTPTRTPTPRPTSTRPSTSPSRSPSRS